MRRRLADPTPKFNWPLVFAGGGTFIGITLLLLRRAAASSDAPSENTPTSLLPPNNIPTGTPPTSRAAPTAVSEMGLRLIASFEGFCSHLYNDIAGHCTIGLGTLVHLGKCNGSESAEFRRGITKDRAWELLVEESTKKAAEVLRLITVPLNQAQLDALVSFVYNVGTEERGLKGSTLRKRLNQGDYASVPEELAKWKYARVNGRAVVLQALVNRRAQEARIFSTGEYGNVPEPNQSCHG